MRRLPTRFIITLLMGLALGGSVLVVAPAVVHGATAFSIENIGGSVGLGTSDLRQIAINVIKWLLGILGLVAVSFLIYGGFLWLTAAGNEERIEKAKRVIVNAVIGLVIVLLSWAIVLYVARFINGVTNGGPNPPGCATPPCAGGLPPVADFRVKGIQTAHEIDSGGNNLKVLRCSGVQPIFNNRSDSTTIAAVLPPNPHDLIVFKDEDGSEVRGSWAYGDQTFMTFSLAPGVKYDPNKDYKVWIPKTDLSILDSDRTKLTACQADGSCNPNPAGTAWEWNFHVGEQDDVAAPTITTTYPIRNGVGYPDTNVSREPVLTVNFSETINLSTVLSGTNTLVQKITGSTPVPDASWTVVTGGPLDVSPQDGIIDANFFDPPTDNGANGFDLHLAQPNNAPPIRFEPFTWYRITVKGVKDLCGNAMAGEVKWDFKTNDTVAGIESFNPTGGGQCTDQRDVFVVFTVPMNANTVRMRIKETIGNTTRNVDDVALFPNEKSYSNPSTPPADRGVFSVADVADPVDNAWRVYKYTGGSAWKIDATYDVAVTTDRLIDTNGTLLGQSWSFTTAPPDQCSCTPYIATLDPGSGGKEQCLSIIGSCFAGTADHAATPLEPEFALSFSPPDPTPIPTGPVLGKSANDIVTTVPANDAFHFTPDSSADPSVRVTIKYDDTAFGTKTSNTDVKYHFSTNVSTQGPCLFSLDHPSGQIGDPNVANGIRFQAQGPASRIDYNPANLATNIVWSDALISHNVPGGQPAPQSQTVRVTDKDGKKSNGLPFQLLDVVAPGPDTPVVESFAPNCGEACLNAGMTVKYKLEVGEMDLDAVTKPSNYKIKECTTAACTAFTPTVFTPTDFAYTSATKTVEFGKSQAFNLNTYYHIIISKSVTSNSVPPKELGNLNYDDDGDLTNDSYSWTFKTKTTNCVLQSVSVSPPSATLTAAGQKQLYVASAYGPISNCSAAGDLIDAGDLTWVWGSNRSDDTPLDFIPPLNQAVYKAVNQTAPNSSTVWALAKQGAVNATGTASLIVDFAHCTDDTDCDNSGQCTGSTCDEDTHRCSPVIKSFSPPDGKIGTWVTVNGCYFDNYGPNSRMIFATDKDGIGFSNAPFCPGLAETWTDSAVTREVPDQNTPALTDDAVSGPIKIVRNTDGLSDTTTARGLTDYMVNTTERPGLCALVPDSGAIDDPVSVKGQNFGAPPRSATDKVKFDTIEVVDYIWNDPAGRTVDVKVPPGLTPTPPPPDPGIPVHLENEGLASNSLPFRVTTTSVPPGPGAPTVVDNQPQGPSVCRNSVVTATFSTAMDQSTFDATNVKLQPCPGIGPAGNCAVPGAAVAVAYQTTPSGFTFLPPGGMLAKNQKYLVTIGTGVKSTDGVALGDTFTWQFTTADTNSPCKLESVSFTLNPGTPDDSSYHRLTSLSDTVGTAHAFAEAGEIGPSPGVYDWTWVLLNDSPATTSFVPTVVPGKWKISALANGHSTYTLTAKAKAPPVGYTGNLSSNAIVDVELCDFPWKYQDTKLLDPVNTPLFNLFYCRGNGVAPTLPELDNDPTHNQPLVKNGTGTCPPDEPALNRACVQREYFFKIKCPQVGPGADVLNAKYCPSPGQQLDFDLGIRIFPNTPLRSPRGWFEKNFPAAGGSSAMTVDSYSAISVGTTTYVAAPFPNGVNPFTSKIYLLSVKDSAPEVSRSIAADLLAHWQFETPSDPTLKAAIARDLIRVGDLRDSKTVIDAKAAVSGTAPALPAGSFITGLSTSAWPSWAATLGTDLGRTLALDPVNTFALPNATCSAAVVPPYEESTCWNQTSKKFFCPAASHIYAYQFSGGTSYGLYANLEYNGSGKWVNGSFNPCSGNSNCGCFNYLVGAGSAVASLDTIVPSAPSSVVANATNDSTISVGWQPSEDYETGVASYEVTRSTSATGPFTNPVTIARSPATITGLGGGTAYFFRVVAKDFAGNLSSPGAPATGELTAPGNISSFSSQ